MRKIFRSRKLWLVGAAASALAVAGVAVAANSASISTVTANLTATTVVRSHTETCTGADGTYTKTHALYTGTATGSADADLNGPVAVDVTSVYSTTKNLGWVNGHVRFNPGMHPRDKAHGSFSAVNSGGTLQGFLTGSGGPGQHVLGNLTATFTSTGGFTAFSLGAGATTNTAIETTRGCERVHPAHPAHPSHPDHLNKGPKHPKHPKHHS